MNHPSLPIKDWLKKGFSLVLLLTIVSSGFLFFNSTPSGLAWLNWGKINYWSILIACLSLIISWIFEVIRLRLIASGLGEQISFGKMLGINLATNFTGNVTPFSSGGVPTQIYLLCRNGIQPGKASAIVTMRVIMTTLLFTILSPILLIIYHRKFPFGLLHQVTTVAIPLASLISVSLITFIIRPRLAQTIFQFLIRCLRFRKLNQKIEPLFNKILNEIEVFHQSIKIFRKGLNFYFTIIFTLLYWTSFFSIAPLLMYAFGFNATEVFLESILFQFILVFILSYIPIPGGSGVMELGLFSVFIFIPLQFRAIFILVWRFISYHLSNVVGGIVLLKIINQPTRQTVEFQD